MAENIRKEKKDKDSRYKLIGKGSGRTLHSILDGTLLTRDIFVKYLPFILFLTFLALIYIGNNYYAEKMLMHVGKIKKDLKEYRYQHISTKSQLMNQSKQSEVARRLEMTGIKESRIPPYKIIIDNKTNKSRKKG